MKTFLSIKEFSEFSGIEITTLRYWDDIGLFSPAKRNPENNYRYYSPEQVIAVNFITVLSSLNIPLKKIGEIKDRRTPAAIVRLIEQQEKLLDTEMSSLRDRFSIIHTRREMINYGIQALKGFKTVNGIKMEDDYSAEDGTEVDITKISVLWEEEACFVLGPRNEWTEGEGFFGPFMHFCKQAENLRINLNYPIAAILDTWDRFMEAPGEPQHFISMDPHGNRRRPAGNYLTGFSRGYYGQFGDLHNRMAEYIRENSLTVFGPVYTTFLLDEISVKDPSQYLAHACVQCAPQKRKRISG